MRTPTKLKTLLVVAVTALLLIPSVSEAQRGRRAGRGYYYGGYGGYYPYYGYGGYGYGGYGGYGGYYGSPGYYGSNVYAAPLQIQSNYPPPYATDPYPALTANGATLIVRLPDPNAEVWLQNAQMQEQGSVRQYNTTPLDPNSNYSYTVRARWMQNGQIMDQTRRVPIHAGQTVNVDFSNP